MEEKKILSKRTIIVLGIAIAALGLTALVINMLIIRETPEQKIARLLDLGNQYLEDLDYEQAIASFDEVLSIEPQNEQAIESEVSTYLAWSEALVAEGKYDQAVSVLKDGYEKLGNNRLQEALMSVEERKNMSELEGEFREYAMEASRLCEMEKYEDASKFLVDINDRLTMLWESGTDRYICKDTGYRALGFYSIDGKNYLYYGDYYGDKRDGNGVWINDYKDNPIHFDVATGEWKNDMPNGYQVIVPWMDNAYVSNAPHADEMVKEKHGNVHDGLWNGTETDIWNNGTECIYRFIDGKVVILDEWDDQYGHGFDVGTVNGEHRVAWFEDSINVLHGISGYGDTLF